MANNFVPNSYLIQILVTGGTPVVSLYDGDPSKLKNGLLSVNVGDRVAWRVPMQLVQGRAYPGYTITFADPSFFGVSSVTVPPSSHGSSTEFLQVRCTRGSVAYTLTVDGVGCVFDPEIQSGGGGSFIVGAETEEAVRVLADYVVTWDTTVDPSVITYSKGNVPKGVPNPMCVQCRETVLFVVAPPNAVTGFTIPFPANANSWQNPFDDTPALTANAASPSLIGQTISDSASGDLNAVFPFTAAATVGGVAKTSDPTKSYSIKLLSTCS